MRGLNFFPIKVHLQYVIRPFQGPSPLLLLCREAPNGLSKVGHNPVGPISGREGHQMQKITPPTGGGNLVFRGTSPGRGFWQENWNRTPTRRGGGRPTLWTPNGVPRICLTGWQDVKVLAPWATLIHPPLPPPGITRGGTASQPYHKAERRETMMYPL